MSTFKNECGGVNPEFTLFQLQPKSQVMESFLETGYLVYIEIDVAIYLVQPVSGDGLPA